MRRFLAFAVASATLAAGSATCFAQKRYTSSFYVPPVYAPVVPYGLPPAAIEGRSVGVYVPPFVAPDRVYLRPEAVREEPWDLEEALGN